MEARRDRLNHTARGDLRDPRPRRTPRTTTRNARTSQTTTLDLSPARSAEDRAFRNVTPRLVPFLFLCWLAAYLDRVNVGFAELQTLRELGFPETVYGFRAGIFFLGYVMFEVPSTIILRRVGARVWIARVMLTWAVMSGLVPFVGSPTGFYVPRFLLGVAEAGFIPGMLLYLTQWFPAERRGRVTALFLTAIPMAIIFGGPLSGWILSAMSGASNLSGWQWPFLMEMVPSLGVATLLCLDDRVADARWLDGGEKRIMSTLVDREQRGKAERPSRPAARRSPCPA